jgi:hypothetical protein
MCCLHLQGQTLPLSPPPWPPPFENVKYLSDSIEVEYGVPVCGRDIISKCLLCDCSCLVGLYLCSVLENWDTNLLSHTHIHRSIANTIAYGHKLVSLVRLFPRNVVI